MSNRDNMIPIPGRLHSVAEGEPVSGADEVLDDALNMEQSKINQLTVGTKNASTGTTGAYPYNGMGRVVLHKNMVNGVNTLTQDMLYKGDPGSRVPNMNTIFVIQYDFVLGEDITVPENCVLEFEGGSLSNGTITGQRTTVDSKSSKIFRNIILDGTFTNEKIYGFWFELELGNAAENDAVFSLITESMSNIANDDLRNDLVLTEKYRFLQTIVFDGTYNVFIDDVLYYLGDKDNTAIIVGDVNTRHSYKNFKIRVYQDVFPTAEDEQAENIGVNIINMDHSRFDIQNAMFFIYPIVVEGNGTGTTNNILTLGECAGYFIHGLTLRGQNGGWCNENLFIGGKFSPASASPFKNQSYGIWLKGLPSGALHIDTNTFIKPNVEGCSVGVHFELADFNTIFNMHNENTDKLMEVVGIMQTNIVIASSDRNNPELISRQTAIPISYLRNSVLSKVFEDDIKLWAGVTNRTGTETPSKFMGSNVIIASVTSPLQSPYIDLGSENADFNNTVTLKGHIIDTSVYKSFIISADIDSTFFVTLYDTNDSIAPANIIQTSMIQENENYVGNYISGGSTSGWAPYGYDPVSAPDAVGKFVTTGRVPYETFTVSDDVKAVFVGVRSKNLKEKITLNVLKINTKYTENLIIDNPNNKYICNVNISEDSGNLDEGDIIFRGTSYGYYQCINNKLIASYVAGDSLPTGKMAGTMLDYSYQHIIAFNSGGNTWRNALGQTVAYRYGATRPNNLTSKDIGYQFFDTSLSPMRPIWWNGTAWVDATGTPV